MTSGLVDGMMEVTQSMRGYKGDEIEWALVGGICLFNMDRDSPAFKPTYEEKTQIETIQVNCKIGKSKLKDIFRKHCC